MLWRWTAGERRQEPQRMKFYLGLMATQQTGRQQDQKYISRWLKTEVKTGLKEVESVETLGTELD